MKFLSIHDKLISFTKVIVVTTLSTFFIILSVIGVVYTRHSFSQIEASIKNNIISKGELFVFSNSISLVGLAEDNAISAMTDLVKRTVDKDGDIMYGIFMDTDRRTLVIAESKRYKLPFAKKLYLDDSLSWWANTIKVIDNKRLQIGKMAFIEFAAPVYGEGGRLGTIRYGISLASTEQVISSFRQRFFFQVLIAFFFMVLAGIAIIISGIIAARRRADAITKPLGDLTVAINAITAGTYTSPLLFNSNDEVGILADNFEKMRLRIKDYTENLEIMVKNRTRELETAQRKLVDVAHKAGMADIAAGTLHNVGNILNSVKASVEAICSIVNSNPARGFYEANTLLEKHVTSLDDFIIHHPHGKKLIRYYLALEHPIKDSFDQIGSNIDRLSERIFAISEVIEEQQSYASAGGLTEEVNLVEIVDATIEMMSKSLSYDEITVTRDYKSMPLVKAQKTKLIHIIVNVLKNAQESIVEHSLQKRNINVTITEEPDRVLIKFCDTGNGIKTEHLQKIFSSGFSTKRSGHGLGLHSCANYMTEMKGLLWAESEGEGKGATFAIEFRKR